MNTADNTGPLAHQQRAIAVIKPLIPPDAEERVNRAVRQSNSYLREQIRSLTLLRLSDVTGKNSVVIKVVDGFPAGVARLIDRYEDPMLWRLIMLQPKLGGVMDGLHALTRAWSDFEVWPNLPDEARGSEPALRRSLHVAHLLQNLAVARKVFDEIKSIEEDILGVYRFSGPHGARIEIYWMAHALFAAAFGLRIEDLTIVTLSHELAHAYTHAGRTIDGTSWDDDDFAHSDPAVVEGLAQHYTEAVTDRIRARAPSAHDAYRMLLEHQSGPYLAHKTWFPKAPGQLGEIVRSAMLQARSRRGAVMEAEWRALLKKCRDELT